MSRDWTRRRFLTSLTGPAAILTAGAAWRAGFAAAAAGREKPGSVAESRSAPPRGRGEPLVIATWNHGRQAVEVAGAMLQDGASLLDAVEKGVNAVENDPAVHSVGLGGLPNEEGTVELDAGIMLGRTLEAGSVAALQNIRNPISVARRVMEKTHHVMLVGEGARRFAIAQGFHEENLLTGEARRMWKEWRRDPKRQTFWKHAALAGGGSFPAGWGDFEGASLRAELQSSRAASLQAGLRDPASLGLPPGVHDTVGSIVRDANGRLCVAVSTSGLEWKLAGRVGDSPIIGCGLYADDEVGAACGTGIGEAIIRAAGSHSIVEAMRRGRTPRQACEEVVRRILRRDPGRDHRVAFLAVNRQGAFGAATSDPEFTYALYRGGNVTMTPVRPLRA